MTETPRSKHEVPFVTNYQWWIRIFEFWVRSCSRLTPTIKNYTMWSCNTNCRRLWRPRHNLSKLRCEELPIRMYLLTAQARARTYSLLQFNSWYNFWLIHANSCSKKNTQHCRRLQFTIDQLSIACVAANNSKFNIQNSTVRTAVCPKDICTAYLEGYFYAKHASK